MAGPPPPPPPPPMPRFGGPPPPPPPPPGKGNPPIRPPPSKDRSALLTDINKGARLKKTVTNDRSAPLIEKSSSSSAALPAPSRAPPVPIPGMIKPPAGAPPIPGGGRLRSTSDAGHRRSESGGGSTGPQQAPAAPQLGGLFAGGMPKLRKTAGGVDTGAHSSEPSVSESDAPARPAARPPPVPPPSVPHRPLPPPESSAPPTPPSDDTPAQGTVSSILANLRKAPPVPQKPDISKGPPPVPGAKRPPAFGNRKVSAPATSSPRPPPTAPPPPPTVAPPIPTAPPPPPAAAPPPPKAPPPPLTAAPPPPTAPPRPPASRPGPPPPSVSAPSTQNGVQAASAAIAMQAARNAFGPQQAPPPPPPPAAPPSAPPPPPSAPPAPLAPSSRNSPMVATPISSRPSSYSDQRNTPPPPQSSHVSLERHGSLNVQPPVRSVSDAAPSNGSLSLTRTSGSGPVKIEDSRFKFQPESLFPKPRSFRGGSHLYRAGRGSSVPLDLSALG